MMLNYNSPYNKSENTEAELASVRSFFLSVQMGCMRAALVAAKAQHKHYSEAKGLVIVARGLIWRRPAGILPN